MENEKKSTYTVYCKRFYENHKEELKEKIKPYQAVYRAKNREALRQRAKNDYQKKKIARQIPNLPVSIPLIPITDDMIVSEN